MKKPRKPKVYISEKILTHEEVKSLQGDCSLYYKTLCEVCGKEFSMHVGINRTICMPCWSRITQKKLYRENPNLGKERLEKRRKTNLERYGVENVFERDDVKKRAIQTKLERYGDMNYNNREKSKKTCLERYGVEYSFQSDNNKQKSIETNLAKYGTKYSSQSATVKEKVAATKLRKYGNPHYVNSEKRFETMLQRYGVKHPMQDPDILLRSRKKYIYDNMAFDSSWEVAYWIYCVENGHTIRRCSTKISYEYNGETFFYEPDFEVDGELVEIKGLQFFKSKDALSEMVNPYDHSKDGKFEAKHQAMLRSNVKVLTDVSFALDYVNKKYTSDFLPLFSTKLPFPYLNQDLKTQTDYGLIQHFHKSIYKASKKGKPSPLEAWHDKSIIKKVALNRLHYVGHCKPSDILQGLSVTRYAPKISVFKPNLAKDLIARFLDDCGTIVDPFSGFSGRMLGAVSCGKRYIGKDINEEHVAESNEIILFRRLQNCCSVAVEDILKKKDVETYDCLFTCPPYGGKEHWNEHNDEVEKTCDEWIGLCLQHYKCKKYLFVVDKTSKYKDYIVTDINKKSALFAKSAEKVVLIES